MGAAPVPSSENDGIPRENCTSQKKDGKKSPENAVFPGKTHLAMVFDPANGPEKCPNEAKEASTASKRWESDRKTTTN